MARQATGAAQAFVSATGGQLKIYEEVLGPQLFTPWAEFLVDVPSIGPGTRAGRRRHGWGHGRSGPGRPGGRRWPRRRDRHQCPHARAGPRQASPNRCPEVRFLESAAAPLAVRTDLFDVAFCQQGLQFFDDRRAALLEMRRALRPGGRLVASTWASIQHCPAHAVVHRVVTAHLPPEPSRRYLRPWSWTDPTSVFYEVEAAGFRSVSVDVVTRPMQLCGDLDLLVGALTSSLEPLLHGLPSRQGALFRELVVQSLLAEEVLREGSIASRTSALLVTGTKR